MVHKTVLLHETIEYLDVRPDGVYIDATCGAGGCSLEILKRLSARGRLFMIDQDPDACRYCELLVKDKKNATVIQSNFSRITDVLHDYGVSKIDGIVFDLGLSSHQIDTPERGFSYIHDAKLDMRMSQSGISAYDVVNRFNKEKIAGILKEYGEEPFANRIAEEIVIYRSKQKHGCIKTTSELSEIIKNAVPIKKIKGHPAKKTFQAVRIFVNSELKNLEIALDSSVKLLNPRGRICVISFHSLEDRIVKNRFSEWSKSCVCPKDFPICVCNHKPIAKILTNKPVLPSNKEIVENVRSKSAKLRVCEKI